MKSPALFSKLFWYPYVQVRIVILLPPLRLHSPQEYKVWLTCGELHDILYGNMRPPSLSPLHAESLVSFKVCHFRLFK